MTPFLMTFKWHFFTLQNINFKLNRWCFHQCLILYIAMGDFVCHWLIQNSFAKNLHHNVILSFEHNMHVWGLLVLTIFWSVTLAYMISKYDTMKRDVFWGLNLGKCQVCLMGGLRWLLKLSKYQFLPPQNGSNNTYSIDLSWGLNEIVHTGCLTQWLA